MVAPGRDSKKIKFKRTEGYPTAACVIHRGPYNTIGLAYSTVMKWIEENGSEMVHDDDMTHVLWSIADKRDAEQDYELDGACLSPEQGVRMC